MQLGLGAGLLARLMDALLELGIVPIPESSNINTVTFPEGEIDFLLLSFNTGTGERAVCCTVQGVGGPLVLCRPSGCLEVLIDC